MSAAASPTDPYRLVYWPALPGRGELVRLVLEDASLPYVDVARQPPDEGGGAASVARFRSDAPGFAPPFLVLPDGRSLSQVAAICDHLARTHDLLPAEPYVRSAALQLGLTIADVVSEAHDTHHPISTRLYFEEQRTAAIDAARHFCGQRLGVWLAYFARTLEASGGDGMLGPITWPDLHLFQLLRGLKHAFPTATGALLARHPGLSALHDRVAARPGIAAYVASERCIPFNEHGIFRAYPELDLPARD